MQQGLDSLARVSRHLREETKTRLRVLRVKDTQEDFKRTFKSIPVAKRHHVQAIIFGNGRITEGVAKSPDYVSLCVAFPELRAIRHASTYDIYRVDHIPSPAFRFRALDSVDVLLASALLEHIPAANKEKPTSVTSLTLRENDEFLMLLPRPYTSSKRDRMHNVARQVKDIQQLNLHIQLEDDADRHSPYNSSTPVHEPFPGFRKEDFSDLLRLDVHYMTRYRNEENDACDLRFFDQCLTGFTPDVRHTRFIIQYPHPVDIGNYIRNFPHNRVAPARDLMTVLKRHFPTLEQIDKLVHKVAASMPCLETFELRIDDEQANPPPLIHYLAAFEREGSTATPKTITKIRTIDQNGMEWLLEAFERIISMDYDSKLAVRRLTDGGMQMRRDFEDEYF